MRTFWVWGGVTVSERLGSRNAYRILQPLEEGGLEAHDVRIDRSLAGKPDLDSVLKGASRNHPQNLLVRIHHGESVVCYIQPGDVVHDLIIR